MFKGLSKTNVLISIIVLSSGLTASSQASELLTLGNDDNIKASISPQHGGELSGLSIKYQGKWHQLLYLAEDYQKQKGWRGKAPIMWPAVGPSLLHSPELQRNRYQLDKTVFPMPVHGFARHQSWQLMEKDEDSALLQLQSNSDTRTFYPFDFMLRAQYQLNKNVLNISYRLDASSSNNDKMPFSIGNHITFNAPLLESQEGHDTTALLFRADHTSYAKKNHRKELGDERYLWSNDWQPVTTLPERQSISLLADKARIEQASGPALWLKDHSGLTLKMTHQASRWPQSEFVHFNLWASNKYGYFSPEPWVGGQNSLNNGLGLLHLSPGASWHWQITIEFHQTELEPSGKSDA